MRRGEVWWADLGAAAGRRPVVLLSRDDAYAVRQLVTVAPVTTRIREIPVEVPLGPEDGLPKRCVANLDSMVTISKASLVQRVSRLGGQRLRAIEEAICFALALSPRS